MKYTQCIAILSLFIVCSVVVHIYQYNNNKLTIPTANFSTNELTNQEQKRTNNVKRRYINEVVAESYTIYQNMVIKLVHNGTRADDDELVNLVRGLTDIPGKQLFPRIQSNRIRKTQQAEAVDGILRGKRNGFYVDSGAYDGETAANSLFFERNRGWNGLLVEMDPYFYTMLRSKNRNAYSINACLSPRKSPIQLTYKESSGQLAKLDQVARKDSNIKVPCFPMETLMLAQNRSHVDYWSLDVEGVELEVLLTVPFNRLDISVISVEYAHVPGGKEEITKYMDTQGYVTDREIVIKKGYEYVKDLILVKKGLLTPTKKPTEEQ